MQINHKLKKLRDDQGLSRESLSDILDISLTTYSRLENGARLPSINELKKLCEYFEVDFGYFLSDSPTINMKNTNNSQGYVSGNVVLVDKEIILTLSKSLDLLQSIISEFKKKDD